MAKLVFGMNMSLDGYVDHDHDAFAPDPVMFKYFIEQTRKAAGTFAPSPTSAGHVPEQSYIDRRQGLGAGEP
jgi:hypothetical protein